MNSYEIAEYILKNKQEIMCIIGGYVDNYIESYEGKDNLFKESQYIRDLNSFITDEIKECICVLMDDKINYEELSLIFDDEKIATLIRKEFVREYLFN